MDNRRQKCNPGPFQSTATAWREPDAQTRAGVTVIRYLHYVQQLCIHCPECSVGCRQQQDIAKNKFTSIFLQSDLLLSSTKTTSRVWTIAKALAINFPELHRLRQVMPSLGRVLS